MNRKFLYPILIILVTIGLYYAERYVDQQQQNYPVKNDTTAVYSVFDESYLPTSTTGAIITHNYLTLSYAEAHEQAEWVAYELQRQHIKDSDFERPYFMEDKAVPSGSAHWRNYKKSGYDRGHLCPAADREFDYNAYLETFLTSNISPQNHEFNAGIWNRLEQKARYWAKKHDGLFVVTGGVLTGELSGIGNEQVSVPEAFYKILMHKSEGDLKAIAFLIPNRPSSRSFMEYTVPIDRIEQQTGIDFFENLTNEVQHELESAVDRTGW